MVWNSVNCWMATCWFFFSRSMTFLVIIKHPKNKGRQPWKQNKVIFLVSLSILEAYPWIAFLVSVSMCLSQTNISVWTMTRLGYSITVCCYYYFFIFYFFFVIIIWSMSYQTRKMPNDIMDRFSKGQWKGKPRESQCPPAMTSLF